MKTKPELQKEFMNRLLLSYVILLFLVAAFPYLYWVTLYMFMTMFSNTFLVLLTAALMLLVLVVGIRSMFQKIGEYREAGVFRDKVYIRKIVKRSLLALVLTPIVALVVFIILTGPN